MANLYSSGVTRRQFLSMASVAGGTLAFTPHLWAAEPHPGPSPLNDMTDQDEIALGDLLAESIEKKLNLVDNGLIDTYLSGIVNSLASVSQRPNLPYRCKLVNSDEVNASSIAGGRLYLNRGLVETIGKEDELVATLSHEIGHIVGRHSANQIMLTFRARKAYDLVKSNIPKHASQILEVIEQLGGGLALMTMLHFSREDEFEADLLGFYEMLRANYQTAGFMSLFNRFIVLEQKSELPPPFLRSHPPAEERAAAIQKELAAVTLPADPRADSLSFHAFQVAMNLLPDVPKEATRPS